MIKVCLRCSEVVPRARINFEGEYLCSRCNHIKNCRKYDRSEKGQANNKRYTKEYSQTDAFKANQKKYLQTEKGKAKQRRWAQSENGKAVLAAKHHRRYWNDPTYYRKKALMRVHGIEDYRLDDLCALCALTEDLTLDHMHPVAKGGPSEDYNFQTLCRNCNSFKKDRLMTPFPQAGVLVGGSY